MMNIFRGWDTPWVGVHKFYKFDTTWVGAHKFYKFDMNNLKIS